MDKLLPCQFSYLSKSMNGGGFMEFALSKYDFFFDCDNKHYVYNTLTTSIVQLDNLTIDSLHNNIESINKRRINILRQEGIIVEKGTNEINAFSYYYDSARFGDSAGTLKITVIPTYGCNMACPYCYEGKSKSNKRISTKEISAITSFADKQILLAKDTLPFKRMDISFFGGEPLLCKREIEKLCAKLFQLAKSNGIIWSSDITTNLTLIDDDFIEALKEYQVELQITLDGNQAEHDKRRIYKNGKGSYADIIRNLKRLSDAGLKDQITVRLNIDEDNIRNAEDMFLAASNLAKTVYFGYLKKYEKYNDEYASTCFSRDCFSSVATEKLNAIYNRFGLEAPIQFGKRSPCMLNQQNAFLIDPYLDVYKCEVLQNHPECKVGVIDCDGNFTPSKSFYNQMAFTPWSFIKCKDCKLMPLCGAGCPAETYIRSGRKDGNILFADCIESEGSLKEYLCDYIKRHKD